MTLGESVVVSQTTDRTSPVPKRRLFPTRVHPGPVTTPILLAADVVIGDIPAPDQPCSKLQGSGLFRNKYTSAKHGHDLRMISHFSFATQVQSGDCVAIVAAVSRATRAGDNHFAARIRAERAILSARARSFVTSKSAAAIGWRYCQSERSDRLGRLGSFRCHQTCLSQ